jgi:hypothetical protein
MMTTMAALMGTLPIALGFGQGGVRRALGVSVVGLFFSQIVTLFLTPVVYIYGNARLWAAITRPKRANSMWRLLLPDPSRLWVRIKIQGSTF